MKFNKHKMLAFELRFNGNTYQQIADHPDMEKQYSKNTLEIHFCKTGIWREEYEEWVNLRKDDINEQVTGMFVAQAQLASQVITNVLLDKNAMNKDRLRAAEQILDRGGYAAIQRISNESETESMAEKILKGMEAQKVKLKGKQKTNGK